MESKSSSYMSVNERKKVVSTKNKLYALNNVIRSGTMIDESSEIKPQYSILKLGTVHPDVKDLKRNLNKLGFGSIKESEKLGKYTKKSLKRFQNFYGLEGSGIADIPTLQKIDKLIESPVQRNKKHEDIIALKKKLNWLGYGPIKVTTFFGLTMERYVKEFQENNGLPVSGIVDEISNRKIDEVFINRYKLGSKHNTIITLKSNLNQIGFAGILETKLYGTFTEQRVKEFQAFYGLTVTGNVDFDTYNKIDEILSSELQLETQHNDVIKLKRDLMTLGYGQIKITKKFGELTMQVLKKFQEDYGLPMSGIADKVTLQKIEKAMTYTEKVAYNWYDLTLNEALDIQMNLMMNDGNRTEVEELINPFNSINHKMNKFQFLDLAKSNSVDADVLNRLLMDKGILDNTGEYFIEAGNEYGMNELFILSQVLLETDNGSSALATGLPVDINGEITYAEMLKNDIKVKVPGMTNATVKMVYNMFGISTGNDADIASYAKKAFDEGWDTPRKAIIGGAGFVREKYIRYDNNTFYKMLWRPTHMDLYGDIGEEGIIEKDWVLEQVKNIYNLYHQLESYNLYLEIPVYRNQSSVRYQKG